MQICFCLRKIQIYLHPRKMQICFCLKKSIGYMQIIEIKKKIVTIIYKKFKITL